MWRQVIFCKSESSADKIVEAILKEDMALQCTIEQPVANEATTSTAKVVLEKRTAPKRPPLQVNFDFSILFRAQPL